MTLDQFEEAVVLEWLHLHHTQLGYSTVKKLAEALGGRNGNLEAGKAEQAINKKPVGSDVRAMIASEGLKMIADQRERMIEAVRERQPRSLPFLQAILDRSTGLAVTESQPVVTDTKSLPPRESSQILRSLWDNWQTAIHGEPPTFWNGAYQMIRLYKPLTVGSNSDPTDEELATSAELQPVICEIIFVNAQAFESILITTEGNEYRGAIFRNYEEVVTTLYQRVVGLGRVNQRYLTSKLVELKLPFYSGICVKVGDTSFRPLASDVLFVPIPEAEHGPLYAELRARMAEPWSNSHPRFIPKESIVWDYLTDNPPRGQYNADAVSWKRVRFLKHFPEVRVLARKNKAGAAYFREPIRTISNEDLVPLGDQNPPPVFRQSVVKSTRALQD